MSTSFGLKKDKLKLLNNTKVITKKEKSIQIKFLQIMSIVIIPSLIISEFLWKNNIGVIHSILELISIFFSISLFFIVWHKYEKSPKSSRFIAFGLLATTIFDIIHIYYYEPLGLALGYGDVATKFWILGRFTEVIMIFISSFSFSTIKLNIRKEILLLVTLLLSMILSYIVIINDSKLPVLFDINNEILTNYKIILESIIVILAIISLLRHRKKNYERGYISYEYLALALMMMIPTEISLMLYKNFNSFTMVQGHVLKILYSYLLYKSIFQGSIDYIYEELYDAKKRLNDILDAIPIGIQTYDSDLKVDFINKEFEKMLCFNKEEVIGLDVIQVKNVLNSNISEGGSLEEKLKYINKNPNNTINCKTKKGNYVKLNLNATEIKNGVLLIFKDVEKEQAIGNLNIQTYTILNSIQSAAFICDNEFNIVSVNKSFQELIGLSYEELVGINVSQLNRFIGYKRNNISLINNRDFEDTEKFEVTFTNVNGISKKVIIHQSDILNIYKKSIGKISVITDITDFKEQQEKLIHQEKLALLGQMGASIVHETRNFLTTIKGCSQLIEVIAKEDKVVKYAKKIDRDIEEVNRIISDFLTLSKPKKTMLMEVSIKDLLETIQYSIETSSLIKGVDIEFIYNVDERYILCDESKLKQVILNICKNSIEAMIELPNSKLIIEAGIIEENNSIYIKVSDNGKGMDKKTLDKIGTPFFTTKQGGTGLGLSVCYDIIKQHRGWIDVTSEIGVGTTFTINIPSIEDDEFDEEILLCNS